jgi:hypothetical protein
MKKYPSLFNIVRKKNASMAQILSTTPLNISFKRALVWGGREFLQYVLTRVNTPSFGWPTRIFQ